MRFKIVPFVLVLCLLFSGLVNIILYRQVTGLYRELQMVRLDPTNTRKFAAENLQCRPPQPGKARIILLGDSRIAYWNPLPCVANCQLLNRGVSGETTAQTILRLDRDIIRLRPSVVVIQVGINDLKTIGVFPKRKDEITETCQKNLRTIVKRTTEHNTHVVVLTVFPPGPVGLLYRLIWSDEIREAVKKTNEMIRGLGGPRVTVVNCDPILSVGKTVKPKYARGTFHLNSAGYQALNDSIVPILGKLLQNYDLAEN